MRLFCWAKVGMRFLVVAKHSEMRVSSEGIVYLVTDASPYVTNGHHQPGTTRRERIHNERERTCGVINHCSRSLHTQATDDAELYIKFARRLCPFVSINFMKANFLLARFFLFYLDKR